MTTTIVFNNKFIDNINLIDLKLNQYTYGRNFLYKTFDQHEDKNHIEYIKNRFNLNDIEYRSLVSIIKSNKNSLETINDKKLKRIESLTEYLNILKEKEKLTKKDKYNIKKTIEKINYLNKSITNNVVFGSRKALQDLTKAHNNKKSTNEILKKKSIYQNKRIQDIYIIGEANQTGNRFIDFDLNNLTIKYKPNKGNKSTIKLSRRKSKNKSVNQIDLNLLQELIDSKSISVTVRINHNETHLSFDLNNYTGYSMIKKEFIDKAKQEIKDFNIKDKQIIKSIYRKNYKSIEEKVIKDNKLIKSRYCSVDLNPDGIGYSIFDVINDKLIFLNSGYIDYSGNNKKLGLSSDDPKQLKQSRKRKEEILYSLTKLFKSIRHYKCYNFVMEELIFTDIDNKKVYNRKINNLWCRSLVTQKINKEIKLSMMKLIEVNPCYSSFIGNIKHDCYDPIAASMEIGRRGHFKYLNGGFFPSISQDDIDTVEKLTNIKVNEDALELSWKSLFKHCVQFGWRRTMNNYNYKSFRVGNKKSNTFVYFL